MLSTFVSEIRLKNKNTKGFKMNTKEYQRIPGFKIRIPVFYRIFCLWSWASFLTRRYKQFACYVSMGAQDILSMKIQVGPIFVL